jgi:acyl-CoA reductase-like NAD-dependent aldehyde dehydrogenase
VCTRSTDWHALAERFQPPRDAFIDGNWCQSQSGERFDKHSPVDGRHLASVAHGAAGDVDLAVRSARRCFDSGAWSRGDPKARRRLMLDWAARIRASKEELAVLIVLEMGKPIRDALGEVDYTIDVIEFYAEAINKVYGEVAATSQSSLAMITREPAGVVGLVLPWNDPASTAAWKLGPALAAGNCCVVKPAEQTPLSTLFLARSAAEAGFPDGVLNVVPGSGEITGAALGLHNDVDNISFTGSSPVGKLFLRYAGESNMKEVSLECGGKSPHIVLQDAPNLDRAAAAAAYAICGNAGQNCNAGSRLLIDKPIAEPFLELVTEHMEKWVPGDPLAPETVLGAIVDEPQLERILGYIADGKSEGAEIHLGGSRARAETGGYYVEPTLFSGVHNDMKIAREEIFGPVLAAIEFDGIDEAIAIANESSYGLAAGIWSRDIDKAHRAARELRAGAVYVNCYDNGDINVTFGGFKESGIGVDKSLHAMHKYTNFKTTWLELGA